MAKEATEKAKYPYLSFQTFLSLITKMEKEGIPARIDRGYLQYTSGTNQIYLPMALRSFGLLNDDDTATEELTALVKKPEERKQLLATMNRGHYTKQMALPENATDLMLEETFNPLTGETKRKAITFFLHAAKEAGIPLSKHFKAPKQSRGGGGTGRKTTRKRKTEQQDSGASDGQPPPPPPPTQGMSRSLELASGGTLTVSLSANIWDLSEEDERFVMGLVKTMRGYGQPKELLPGVPAEQEEGEEEGGQT